MTNSPVEDPGETFPMTRRSNLPSWSKSPGTTLVIKKSRVVTEAEGAGTNFHWPDLKSKLERRNVF